MPCRRRGRRAPGAPATPPALQDKSHFTPEQRNFLMMRYNVLKGEQNCLRAKQFTCIKCFVEGLMVNSRVNVDIVGDAG